MLFKHKLFVTIALLLLIIILLITNNKNEKDLANQDDDFKIYVSYVHKIDTNDDISQENFRFFMNFGLLPCDHRVHYRITLNSIYVYSDFWEQVGKILNDEDLIQFKK